MHYTYTLPFIGIRGTFAKSPTIHTYVRRILTNTRRFDSSESVRHYHWWRQQWVPKCLVFYGWWHNVQYVRVCVRTYVPTYTTQRMYCSYIAWLHIHTLWKQCLRSNSNTVVSGVLVLVSLWTLQSLVWLKYRKGKEFFVLNLSVKILIDKFSSVGTAELHMNSCGN